MPRLPLRPPITEDMKHWPDQHMHSAPWTNTSISMGERSQI